MISNHPRLCRDCGQTWIPDTSATLCPVCESQDTKVLKEESENRPLTSQSDVAKKRMFTWCNRCKYVRGCYDDEAGRGPNYLEPACGEGPA